MKKNDQNLHYSQGNIYKFINNNVQIIKDIILSMLNYLKPLNYMHLVR